MRTGYTYDDEMPQAHGSFQNNNRHRRKPFTGKKVAEIYKDPDTGQVMLEYDEKKWKNKPENNQGKNDERSVATDAK